jgi:hypothetical protein
MTVRARQLARLCRERLAAQQDLPVLVPQPRQTAAQAVANAQVPASVPADEAQGQEPEQPVL